MARFAVCLDTLPNCQWAVGVQVPGHWWAGAVNPLWKLWHCSRSWEGIAGHAPWSQGKSLWGNPKPPPTAKSVDLLVEFCKWNGCGHTGYPGSFPEKSATGPPLQPWFPSLLPILRRPKAAGYAVPNTTTELLCRCHCCCCCSRHYSQGGFKLGTFSNIWISVVFKRLFVTQSDFLPDIWEGVLKPHSVGIPSTICPCSCVFLVQDEWPSSSSLQLCAMS